MLILEVSSVHQTHKHASLNDSFAFSHSKRTVSVAFVHGVSIICQGAKKGLQLKHHGYLAKGGRVFIQTPTRDVDGMTHP